MDHIFNYVDYSSRSNLFVKCLHLSIKPLKMFMKTFSVFA